MGAFDRFRKLENPRPERSGGPTPPPDAVAGRFGQPEMPSDPADSAPLNCGRCGADNQAKSEKCFNCDADLHTPEMRRHQEARRARFLESQQRANAARETRKREAEAAAERELAARRQRGEQVRTPADEQNQWWSQSRIPLVWLLSAASGLPDPQLRLGVQIAIVAAFLALVVYAVTHPMMYGLWLVIILLVGGGGGGYYRRRRRWWR
jgi:hypothetical protein